MEKEERISTALCAGTNTELSLKYQKLATEFAKVRSQLNVLKKGILDEQNKSAILKDELNERDKTIRKYEQEIDSYSFRNQQLEKRVGILQEDLTAKAKKSSKKSDFKKGEHSSAQELSDHDNAVPLTELLTKIDENVQLTRQITQQEEGFRKQLIDLTSTSEEKLTSATSHFREIIRQLQTENASLIRSRDDANEEIKSLRNQICDFEDRTNLLAGPVQKYPTSGTVAVNESIRTQDQAASAASSAVSCDLINKLVKSQQETEFWKVEFELNKIKLNKALTKYEDCKKYLRDLGREDLLGNSSEVTSPDIAMTTMFGKMTMIMTPSNDIDESNWSGSQEKELISYFTKRINELIHLLQLCDRKAVTFQNECNALQAHLLFTVDEKTRVQQGFDELQTKHVALSEELLLITSTYEAQLQTLTEHIANMNDKLALQTDTIDSLESQLKHGTKKK